MPLVAVAGQTPPMDSDNDNKKSKHASKNHCLIKKQSKPRLSRGEKAGISKGLSRGREWHSQAHKGSGKGRDPRLSMEGNTPFLRAWKRGLRAWDPPTVPCPLESRLAS